ncbi:uncharacterized protein [Panulirus ornatus]|uniref:uncharacterized protein n=1 Tax=Panulirus ornatus TaxID=150431 RepID=UPI003A8B48FC
MSSEYERLTLGLEEEVILEEERINYFIPTGTTSAICLVETEASNTRERLIYIGKVRKEVIHCGNQVLNVAKTQSSVVKMECDEASIQQEGNKEEIHEKADESSFSNCPEQADVEKILEDSYTSSPSGSLEQTDDKEELYNADKYSSSGSLEQSEDREELFENDDKYSSCGSLEQLYDKEELLESEDESIFSGSPKTSYDKEKMHEKSDESSSSSSPEQAGVKERTAHADKCSSSGISEQVDEKEKILKDDDKCPSICSPDQSYYKKEIFENDTMYSSASSPEQSYNKEEMQENIDNYYSSSSPEQSYDREEMLEYADKYSSSSSPEQSYDKEEMLENADRSFSSGSPEQTDDKDEIHENANNCFSGSSPEQLDVDEMLDNVDICFSGSSLEQADNKEDILENASKYSSCGILKQADNKEEILENADKNSFSGNRKQAYNKEEMFKSANKSISSGSTKQSDCNEEMPAKPNDASSGDSQEQVDDNEELLEFVVKSFSGSKKQENCIEEMMKSLDKSSPSGSPRETDTMEEVHENVNSSSFSVDLEKLTHHVNKLDETLVVRSACENFYKSSLSQKNASSTNEHEIIHNESRLNVGTTSPSILQRHAVCSDKDENMRKANANSCSSTLDSLVKTDQVTDESVTECLQSVDTADRLLKTDKEISAFNFISENRQNAAPSTTNSVQDSPGSYCVIDKENRQIIGIDDFSDGLESSLGTVKRQVVNDSVSENRQDVDTTTADGCCKELMNRGVVTEVILESRDVSSCDVDYADSPVIDVAHIKLPVLDSKEDNSTFFISASENLNTIKTQVDRLPLLVNKDEHNPFDLQRSVSNTDGENDGKIGNLENLECVQKVKKKYKKKPCAMTRGTQTAIQLLDSSEFRDYPLDLATMQVEVGFMSVDDLQDLDPSLDDWPVLLVSQLRLRDTIINTLNAKLLDLLSKGRRLEEDVDYLKLKIWDLKQQVKKKSQNKKEQCSQTTDEDFANAWKKWYCGTWHQYYGESDPSSVHYWPGHYSQHTTVSSLSQFKPTGDNEDSNLGIDGTILIEDETQDNTDKTDEKEGESGQISVNTQNIPHRTAESNSQEQSFDSKVDSIEQDKQILKRNMKNQREHCKSQKDSDGGLIKSDKDNRKYETKTSSINTSHRLTESGEIAEKILTKSSELENLDTDNKVRHGHENFRQENQDTSDKSNIAGVDCQWDASGVSITNQVKAVAAEAVQNTGYVFQEELGLYYDYTSGYYYDAENGLYYDSKTGTYFITTMIARPTSFILKSP